MATDPLIRIRYGTGNTYGTGWPYGGGSVADPGKPCTALDPFVLDFTSDTTPALTAFLMPVAVGVLGHGTVASGAIGEVGLQIDDSAYVVLTDDTSLTPTYTTDAACGV